MVCTGCCATLDHIVTYLFKKVTNKGKMKRVFTNDNFLSLQVRSHEARVRPTPTMTPW